MVGVANRAVTMEGRTPGATATLATATTLGVAIPHPETTVTGAKALRGLMIEEMIQDPDNEAVVGTGTAIAMIVATRGPLTGTALETIATVATIAAMSGVMIEGIVGVTAVVMTDEMTVEMIDGMIGATASGIMTAATIAVAVVLIEQLTREMKPVRTNQSRMLSPATQAQRQIGGKTKIRLYSGARWSR